MSFASKAAVAKVDENLQQRYYLNANTSEGSSVRKIIGIVACIIASLTLPAYADDKDANKFTLATTAVLDGGALPVLYTCDGKDIQPEFSWINLPAKTQTLAILISDPDAPSGTFYHWILFNIPKSTKDLPEGMAKPPAGAELGKNSFDKTQYSGPCPPKGTAHTYHITLYALDTKLNLPANSDGKTVLDAMKDHIVDQAKFTTVYSRWIN